VLQKAGGVLKYGIPKLRIPKKIVESEVSKLEKIGVKILCDVPVGNAITIPSLQKEYDYIFIGTGAGLPKFMNIPGEDANEVFAANEILTRINLMKAYKDDAKTPIKKGNIAYVIGGGNVAMDAVRCLRRFGMETHLMYRRSMDELPARKMEVNHAMEEGIIFDLLSNPVSILTDGDNHVVGMNVVDMELGEADESGRRSVTEKKNSMHEVKCDMVVMALGTSPNHLAFNDSKLKLDEKGLIITNEGLTSLSNVYAGGDAVTGAATVILAMEAGKKAAKEIMESIG
jgi:glutamate synthase (NADPH/NADH) small chain